MNLFQFPIKQGTKQPAVKWTQIHRLSDSEVQEWLDKGFSLALATGEISDKIEVIDIDDASFLDPWMEAVAEAGHVSLFDKMPRVRTSKGWHFYYRCDEVCGNTVLARAAQARENGGDTAIETRGNGGYVVVPNRNDSRYEWEHGNGDHVPTITPEEREVLWECARRLNQKPEQQKDFSKHPNKPGDDYNQRHTWEEILEPRGWTLLRERPDGVKEWCRPGKNYGISATTGMHDGDFLYVFSSNAGLPDGKGYSKFGFYVHADHGGDYAAAAKQLAGEGYGEKPKRKRTSALKVLLSIGMEAETFRSTDGLAYAYYEGIGAVPVKSDLMKLYLDERFEAMKGRFAPEKDLTDAVNKLDRAISGRGKVMKVFNRVGHDNNAVYVDLSQRDNTRAVRITAEGWTIVDKPEVMFRRTGSSVALPDPERGGSIEQLRPFVNVGTEDQWRLLVAWVLGCFNPKGTLPVMIIQGDAGAAKSYGTTIVRRLVDPMVPPLLPYPRSSESLIHHAYHNYVLAFDNLSGVSNEISDTLCVLASGSGYATRKLYTNLEQVTFEARRPIVINGIDNLAHRNDLSSRSLSLTFEEIERDDKLSERLLEAEIAKVMPNVLGHIYDAVAKALACAGQDTICTDSRLIDFTDWIVAAAPALGWSKDNVADLIEENTQNVLHAMAEADLVAQFMIKFMEESPQWSGSASDLFEQLDNVVPHKISRSRDWPNSPLALGKRVQRAKPTLRAAGIKLNRRHTKNGNVYELQHMGVTA